MSTGVEIVCVQGEEVGPHVLAQTRGAGPTCKPGRPQRELCSSQIRGAPFPLGSSPETWPIHRAASALRGREVARTRSWPASEASWLVFSDEAELVSREVAGLELGGRDRSLEEGMHLGLRSPPPPTPSVRRVGQRRDSCRTFASPPGGGASAKPGLL